MCSNDISAILILSAAHSLSLPSDFVCDLDYKIISTLIYEDTFPCTPPSPINRRLRAGLHV